MLPIWTIWTFASPVTSFGPSSIGQCSDISSICPLNERQRFIVEEVEARRIATTPPARCPGVVARPHRRQRRLGALQGIPYILRRRDVVVVPAAAAAAYCCFGGVEGRQLFVIPILVHRSYQHGL